MLLYPPFVTLGCSGYITSASNKWSQGFHGLGLISYLKMSSLLLSTIVQI